MKLSPLVPYLRKLASLKLAVVVLLSLAVSLAVGTVLESVYDTANAQYFVYRATWFRTLLILLGINIASVMVDRWPWKKRHVPFLLAHIGILTLLWGSLLTDRYGLDGMMRVSEGESTSAVELDTPILAMSSGKDVFSTEIPWLPPGVGFKPYSLRSKGVPIDVTVDQFLSHADQVQDFLPDSGPNAVPAVQVRVAGGPMRIRQDVWLWAGGAEWSALHMGPAWIGFKTTGGQPMPPAGPRLLLDPIPGGGLSYLALGSSGEQVKGSFDGGKVESVTVPVPWKGGVKVSVLRWIPKAKLLTSYKLSRLQYRDMAPPSAIHLTAGPRKEEQAWLSIGDRAVIEVGGAKVEVGYFRRRVVLPFSIHLDHFKIDRYEGSERPREYSSQVSVLDTRVSPEPRKVLISMNEPLQFQGVTLYQSSYEDGVPRPVTSVFSVNQDPGRPWKYAGSLFIVLGSIWLFGVKYMAARPKQKGKIA